MISLLYKVVHVIKCLLNTVLKYSISVQLSSLSSYAISGGFADFSQFGSQFTAQPASQPFPAFQSSSSKFPPFSVLVSTPRVLILLPSTLQSSLTNTRTDAPIWYIFLWTNPYFMYCLDVYGLFLYKNVYFQLFGMWKETRVNPWDVYFAKLFSD